MKKTLFALMATAFAFNANAAEDLVQIEYDAASNTAAMGTMLTRLKTNTAQKGIYATGIDTDCAPTGTGNTIAANGSIVIVIPPAVVLASFTGSKAYGAATAYQNTNPANAGYMPTSAITMKNFLKALTSTDTDVTVQDA